MKREELALEKKCRNEARKRGWVAIKMENNGHNGVPDDIFLLPHTEKYFFVEFKRSKEEKLRKEQVFFFQIFDKTTFLVADFDDFLRILEDFGQK